jgi:hypothetical protein
MSISVETLGQFYIRLPKPSPENPLSIVSCLKALEGLDLGDSNAIQKLAKVVKAVTDPSEEAIREQPDLATWKKQAQAIADSVVKSHFFGEIERKERDVFLKASSNNVHNFAMRFLELGRMAWNRVRYNHGKSKANQEALCERAVKNLQEVVKSLIDNHLQQEGLSVDVAVKFLGKFNEKNEIQGHDGFGKAFAKDISRVPKEVYTSWHDSLRESVPARRKRRQWGTPQEIKIRSIPDEAQQTESKRPEWVQELIMQLQETLKTLLPKEELLAIVNSLEIDWPPEIKENNDQGKANLHIAVLNLLGYEFQPEHTRVAFIRKSQKGTLPPNFDAAAALLPQIEKAFGIANLTIEDQEEPVAEESTSPLQPESAERQRKRWDRPHPVFFPAREESAPSLPHETVRGHVKPRPKTLSQKAKSMMQKIQDGKFNSQTEKVNELSNEQWLEVVRECIAMVRTETERQRIVVKVLNFIRDKLIPYLGKEGENFKASLEQIPGLRQSDRMDLKTKTLRVAIGLHMSE